MADRMEITVNSAAPPTRPSWRRRAVKLSLLAAFAACAEDPATPPQAPGAATTSASTGVPADADLTGWRIDLLEIAFRAASALPLDPHVKNRARSQAAVVAAALQLAQPNRAAEWLRQIPNWQRGLCAADLAVWCVQHGAGDAAGTFLAEAEAVADRVAAEPQEQGWRAERIRARTREAILLLDETSRRELAAGAEGYRRILAGIDGALAAGDLEAMTSALTQCTGLFADHFGDAGRRGQLQERVRAARVPEPVRMDLTLRLAEIALDHGDAAEATALLDELQRLAEAGRWLPEDAARLRARLAAVRHRAGARERARADLTAATAEFEVAREQVDSVFRGAALRALAEAWQHCGDTERARGLYQQAIGDAVVNPNSRPRAEDLVATCLSMAVAGVVPDAGLLARMRKIAAGLGPPW